MESGWRPNAVKMGDRWYQYQTIQPINVPAAVIANAVEDALALSLCALFLAVTWGLQCVELSLRRRSLSL